MEAPIFKFEILETTNKEEFVRRFEVYLNGGWEPHERLIAFPTYTDQNGRVQTIGYIQGFILRQ